MPRVKKGAEAWHDDVHNALLAIAWRATLANMK